MKKVKMNWRTFKKNCKERNEIGKCKIKVSYRYNDYCEKGDCPKFRKWASEGLVYYAHKFKKRKRKEVR